jgi:hypothetical protein
MTEVTQGPTPHGKPKRQRSPNFPGLNLEAAITKAEQVLMREGLHAAPVEVVAKDWGLSAKSSTALVAFGAMKAFGLLDKEGDKLKLSTLARDIVQDKRPNSDERQRAIQRSALTPRLHQEIWAEYKGDIPSDDNLKYSLIRGRQFTENGAKEFIAQFRATLAYAKLTPGSNISDENTDSGKADVEPEVLSLEIGEFVQWTSGGADQFPLPRRVEGFSDDKKFVFVEGTKTGLPRQEVTKADPPARRQPLSPAAPQVVRSGMIQEAINLAEGQFVLQWPSHISAEEYEDLEAWLKIMLKRVKKAVKPNEPEA